MKAAVFAAFALLACSAVQGRQLKQDDGVSLTVESMVGLWTAQAQGGDLART